MNLEMDWVFLRKYLETKIKQLQVLIMWTNLIILDRVKTYQQIQNKNLGYFLEYRRETKLIQFV